MWAALALVSVLEAAPAADLALKNQRMTYGVLGQERKNKQIVPGDVVVVAFDIEGLTVKDDGRVLYSMGMELLKEGKAKPEFKRDPQDMEAVNNLGGNALPAYALTMIGTDTKEGKYTLRVTIRDRSSKKEEVLNQSFEVVKPQLGFVQVRLTYSGGDPSPPVGVPGQKLFLHCVLTGFALKAGQPNVTFEMQIYDDAGKATVKTPFKGDITTEVKGSLMQFLPIPIDLNRAGKYKVTIKAVDNLGGKKATVEHSLDLTVLSR